MRISSSVLLLTIHQRDLANTSRRPQAPSTLDKEKEKGDVSWEQSSSLKFPGASHSEAPGSYLGLTELGSGREIRDFSGTAAPVHSPPPTMIHPNSSRNQPPFNVLPKRLHRAALPLSTPWRPMDSARTHFWGLVIVRLNLTKRRPS